MSVWEYLYVSIINSVSYFSELILQSSDTPQASISIAHLASYLRENRDIQPQFLDFPQQLI